MAGKLVCRGTTTNFGVSFFKNIFGPMFFFMFSTYPFFKLSTPVMFCNWSVPKNNFPLVGKPPLPPAGSVIRSCFQEREQLNAFFLLLLHLHLPLFQPCHLFHPTLFTTLNISTISYSSTILSNVDERRK